MSRGEAGVNPIEAMDKAERAEAMAEAMAGLEHTFEAIMDEVCGAASMYLNHACRDYQFDTLDDLRKVRESGMGLAQRVQGADIAIADTDNAQEFQGAWPGLPRVNFPAGVEAF